MAPETTSAAVRVLAIPGSLRRDSWNRRLLEAAAGCTPPGMSIDVAAVGLLAAIPPFNEDLETDVGGDPEPVGALRAAVRRADGLLISTPEYNQSLPGVLKNHVDWLSRPRPDEVLLGKPVAAMGATTGEWGTRLAQSLVRQTLAATGALVLPPSAAVYVRHADRVLSAGGGPPPALLGRLRGLLKAFAEWIDRCGRSPTRARS